MSARSIRASTIFSSSPSARKTQAASTPYRALNDDFKAGYVQQSKLSFAILGFAEKERGLEVGFVEIRLARYGLTKLFESRVVSFQSRECAADEKDHVGIVAVVRGNRSETFARLLITTELDVHRGQQNRHFGVAGSGAVGHLQRLARELHVAREAFGSTKLEVNDERRRRRSRGGREKMHGTLGIPLDESNIVRARSHLTKCATTVSLRNWF